MAGLYTAMISFMKRTFDLGKNRNQSSSTFLTSLNHRTRSCSSSFNDYRVSTRRAPTMQQSVPHLWLRRSGLDVTCRGDTHPSEGFTHPANATTAFWCSGISNVPAHTSRRSCAPSTDWRSTERNRSPPNRLIMSFKSSTLYTFLIVSRPRRGGMKGGAGVGWSIGSS